MVGNESSPLLKISTIFLCKITYRREMRTFAWGETAHLSAYRCAFLRAFSGAPVRKKIFYLLLKKKNKRDAMFLAGSNLKVRGMAGEQPVQAF